MFDRGIQYLYLLSHSINLIHFIVQLGRLDSHLTFRIGQWCLNLKIMLKLLLLSIWVKRWCAMELNLLWYWRY